MDTNMVYKLKIMVYKLKNTIMQKEEFFKSVGGSWLNDYNCRKESRPWSFISLLYVMCFVRAVASRETILDDINVLNTLFTSDTRMKPRLNQFYQTTSCDTYAVVGSFSSVCRLDIYFIWQK